MKTTIFILLLSLATIVQSQDIRIPAEKSLALNLGYQSRLLADEQKSALTYTSGEYLAGVSFTRTGQRAIMAVGLDASLGGFRSKSFRDRWLYITSYDIYGKPEIDSFPVTAGIISGRFQISYLKFLNQERSTRWLAGATLKEFLVYPDNNIGLLNSLGLHVNLALMQSLGNRGTIRSGISFPILALNSRLPWHNTATAPLDNEVKTFFKKGSRLVGIDKFRMIEFNLEFDVRLAHRWSLGAGYAFTYIGIPYHQPLRSLTNTFRIKTALIF